MSAVDGLILAFMITSPFWVLLAIAWVVTR